MSGRFAAVYRVRSSAGEIESRAGVIAVEQSVEMPLAAIDDPGVLSDIVGVVEGILDVGGGWFEVRIGLACSTVGGDAGQLLNMAFGNTSLHEDVVLWDVVLPEGLSAAFGGPSVGVDGLRSRLGVRGRALTGSALKPQGLAADRLALLAERLALGGLDFIKDDHGLADQGHSPFAERVRACAAGVDRAVRRTGHPARYVPSLTGDLDRMRAQAGLAREVGVDCVMVAPMVSGFSALQALVRDFRTWRFLLTLAWAGAARIAPGLLIGGLFRLVGADAVIFPSFGGRFGYSRDACVGLAERARRVDDGLKAALPVAAGGMTVERTGEILSAYGVDTMLLIGGSLLMAGERVTVEAARFAAAVADFRFG